MLTKCEKILHRVRNTWMRDIVDDWDWGVEGCVPWG